MSRALGESLFMKGALGDPGHHTFCSEKGSDLRRRKGYKVRRHIIQMSFKEIFLQRERQGVNLIT